MDHSNRPIGDTDPTINRSVQKTAIQELRERVQTLPPEQHEEVHSVIDQIEEMLEKGPKAFVSVKMLLDGLVTYWPTAVPWLTNLAQQVLGM